MADINEYPRFSNGDVLVVSPTGRSWQLQSSTLKNSLKLFRDLLEKQEPKKLTKRHRYEGKVIQWMLKMIICDPNDLRFVDFEAVDLTLPQQVNLSDIMLNGQSEPAYNRTYDMLFKCIYNIDPDFSINDKTGHQTVFDGVTLLMAAEKLGAENLVRMKVETVFLPLGQILWTHVGANPEPWADLAIRLQSPVIFKEAMIHIVGAFNLKGGIHRQEIEKLDHGEAIIALAQAKVEELEEKKVMVEMRLMTFYPPHLHHPATEEYIPGRAVYAEDIYDWQALTILRQYLSLAFIGDRHHRAPDGGVSFYRTIGKGGSAYLNKETLNMFHTKFVMSVKGRLCLAGAVEQAKMEMRAVVKDLLEDRTSAVKDPKDPPLPYLTCTEILNEELPWYSAPAAEKPQDILGWGTTE